VRILEVLTCAEWGGREDFVVGLSAGLQALGHQVILACPPDTPMWRRAQASSLPLVPIPAQPKRFSLSGLVRMHRLLDAAQADVLHLHDRATYACLLHNFTRFRQRPMIFTMHAVRRLNARRRLVFRHLAHRIVCPSTAVRDALLENGIPAARLTLIPNGVDTCAFDPEALPTEGVRERLGLPAEAPVVAGIGRLSAEKGFDEFLRAAQLVLGAGRPDVRFLLVGDGPQRPALEALARDLGLDDRVIFAGFHEDIAAVLACADIAFLPTIVDESFGMIMAQAGAMGVPVVATRSGAATDIIEDGVTGLLVEKSDPPAAAAALCSLLADEPRRLALGQAAQRRVREHFSIRLSAQRYADLAAQLLAQTCTRARTT